MSYARILVPVDGSHTSANGMKEALKLAKASGAKVLLLHAVEEYPAFATPKVGVNLEPVIAALREAGKQTLDAAVVEARNAGAEPEARLLDNASGRVADSIVEEAQRWGADLIVMGTHGRRGVKRALLGSDAEIVVRYSPIPVLLVPHPAK